MGDSKAPVFPCTVMPEDSTTTKLLGLYPQRQEGLWMQRIKITGGLLTAEQWSELAKICERHSSGTPMTLTTRQDLEFHNLTPDKIPGLQADLAAAGLTGLGACGDTLRNITLCPGNGLCEGTPDLTDAAASVRRVLENYSDIYALPRKFKISFSACRKSCAQPWINDLGFIAGAQNGRVNIKVIGAGSLGARPATGIVMKEALPAQDVPAFALAAVRIFNAHGDRKVRSKARLRHVRERLGDTAFLALLNKELEICRGESLPAVPGINILATGYQFVTEFNFPLGVILPEQAEAISTMMREKSISFRIQNHHKISVFSKNAEEAVRAIRAEPSLSGLPGNADVASCPGSTYCKEALVNTHAAEESLRKSLPDNALGPIRISGCPNGCAHSAVAGIGLSGRVRKDENGNRVEGFQVFTGGGMGLTDVLANEYEKFVPSADTADMILKI